jgi:hypothetical protein
MLSLRESLTKKATRIGLDSVMMVTPRTFLGDAAGVL